MATQQLPAIPNQQTDLSALLQAFMGSPSMTPSSGAGINTSQSSQNQSSSSSTTPAFMDVAQNLINLISSGNSPYSKNAAIADMEGVASNMARRALETHLPSITAAPRLAGAYNSTTESLMKNDLAARTTGEIAGAISENINRYAGIEQGYANSLSNLMRAGTSQQSSSTGTGSSSSFGQQANFGQSTQSNAGKAAVGQLGLSALGGLLPQIGKLASGLFGSSGGSLGITDVMGMPGSSWNSGLANNLYDTIGGTSLGTGTALGTGLGSLFGQNTVSGGDGIGFNYGGTAGGITSLMNGTQGGGGGSFWDSIGSSISSGLGGIGDWLSGVFSFADGGQIPGKAPADRKKDNVTINARSGEYIIIPEAVSALGPDFFEQINQAFMPKELSGAKGQIPSSKKAGGKGLGKTDSSSKGYAAGGFVDQFGSYTLGGEGERLYYAPPPSSIPDLSNVVSGSLLGTLGGSLGEDGSYTFAPQAVNSAPVIDTNSPQGQALLQAGNSMDAAWMREGVNAFIPGDLNYFDFGGDSWQGQVSGETDVTNPEQAQYREAMVNDLSRVAKQLGFDISGYDLSADTASSTKRFDELGMSAYNEAAKQLGLAEIERPKDLTSLYTDLNEILSPFVRYRGASAGWDGSDNMRSTSEALYHNADGVWTPISDTKSGVKREHKGWAREEGADTLAALSVMLPAVGGWAGLLGQAGTSYAPLINAAGGYAMTGNPTSLIGALGGYGGSQLAPSLGLSAGLGNQIGSQLLKQIYSQSQQKKQGA